MIMILLDEWSRCQVAESRNRRQASKKGNKQWSFDHEAPEETRRRDFRVAKYLGSPTSLRREGVPLREWCGSGAYPYWRDRGHPLPACSSQCAVRCESCRAAPLGSQFRLGNFSCEQR